MPVMAIGVAELKRELKADGGLAEFPEIHQFLDGFYLSRIGIRILIGQHIALHEPQRENHIGEHVAAVHSSNDSPVHALAVTFKCVDAYFFEFEAIVGADFFLC